MKKNILIFTLFVALVSTPALYLNANSNLNQTAINAEEDLQFSSIDIDQLPEAIVDVITKKYEGNTVDSAAVAKTKDDVAVYQVVLKDAEGKLTKCLFNEDGTVYEK
ncbi:hypothetical protein [Plebeiibacterium marinum]|uniref:Beta-lactamase-inhibitor-like PepSY-like domain-containing protein n=1 Tax=Plebeiibacterium marinum TaxID=2992111 RepID=A0AAE3MFZ7_9BACT|nr:hypothetical protein [Plebeiobacterium marinum]MCW3806922.1 hypothetical protein [Plebeiobacterium marinum]